jgi:hypothetical protein
MGYRRRGAGRAGGGVAGDGAEEIRHRRQRANIMAHAANLKAFHPPMMLPGISVTTTPDNYGMIHQMQFQRFNGTNWELYGDVVSDSN